jgi:hypothetical protein
VRTTHDASNRPKRVSPSTIARYFFHDCERFLRYVATPAADRSAEGIPLLPSATSPVTTAILDSGYAWEERVVGRHLRRRVEVATAPVGRPIRERIHSAESSRRLIAHLRPGNLVYQPTLHVPPSFYDAYGIDPRVVTFVDSRPDLIACSDGGYGRLSLRVIDVKASPGLKLSHRIQAVLYSLILEHALREWQVLDRQVAYEPGVWLAGSDAPETFDARVMRPPLEDFLRRELQPLMERQAAGAAWHVYFRCEWCEWFQHCQEEMRRYNDVSRMPYLSGHAKRFLAELKPPVRSLGELDQVLDSPAAATLDDCATLRGAQARLAAQARSLLEERTESFGAASLAMPRGEHVRLILTLQTEPVSGQLYTWGILAQGLRDVLGDRQEPVVDVATADEPAQIDRLERRLVRELHGLLRGVHDYNASLDGDWAAQKTVQVYVYDSYEHDLLIGLLGRRLLDPEVADEALALFFHFQEPALMEAEDHPATEVFFPVVVLVRVLRDLLALPIEVAYRFADAVRLLPPSRYSFSYRDDRLFSFQLSNQMRSDAIFQVWKRGRSNLIESIAREVRSRLRAANSLVNGIREEVAASGAVFAWPPRFRLPERMGFNHPVLSRLAFIARYESVLGYLAVREARMAPLAERLRRGDAVRLTYAGGQRFLVDAMHQDLDLWPSGYPQWLLTEDTDSGRQAALTYHDYANRNRVWAPRNLPLALASIASVETSDERPNQALQLDVPRSSAVMPRLQPQRRYLLHPRFTDFNTARCITGLGELDQEAEPPFLRLLQDPDGASGRQTFSPSVRRAIELADQVGMTASQLAAMARLTERTLLLVWGPPGTGKTHFLALAVLSLAAAHLGSGQPFRVLVSAFTHAAIDNCLRQVAEVSRRHPLVPGGLRIAKLGRAHLPGLVGVEEVTAASAADWLAAGPVAVAGGTAWAVRQGVELGSIDLLVIDEGSQLKVPESSISIRRLRPGGTLIVAGDDRQLPPIVQGAYPEPATGEPLLHRSIFECLRTSDERGDLTAMLLENFRMNRTLCAYPAEQIYSPQYRSATAEVAGRRLRLTSLEGTPTLADAVLDPAFPLVVGLLDGVRAAAENRIEADIAAAAACRLRERTEGVDDADFWRHRLFIVCPHHAQIHAIRRALRARRSWRADPFVDTVDRMQGQECDAVIASYGVSDVEYAMREAAFIYSLNRLNVSITRARAKTIVFLPRPLIEPPIQAYEDETIAAGVAFMQGLVSFAERHGEARDHMMAGSAVTLRLFRVPDSAD